MRRGLGKGTGKGYRNIIGKDPKVHSDSAMGRKQPQRIKVIPLSSSQKRGWITKQSSSDRLGNIYLKKEISKEYAFDKKSFGSITVLSKPHERFGELEYCVFGQLYDTKNIGLSKGDRAITKKRMDRVKCFVSQKKALELANQWQKEITNRI